MKNRGWVSIAGVGGICVIAGLIFINYALTAQYNEITCDSYAPNGVPDNEAGVPKTFSEPAAIRQQMIQRHALPIRKRDLFGHPAPLYSDEKRAALAHYQQKINLLQAEISLLLNKFSNKIRAETVKIWNDAENTNTTRYGITKSSRAK